MLLSALLLVVVVMVMVVVMMMMLLLPTSSLRLLMGRIDHAACTRRAGGLPKPGSQRD